MKRSVPFGPGRVGPVALGAFALRLWRSRRGATAVTVTLLMTLIIGTLFLRETKDVDIAA